MISAMKPASAGKPEAGESGEDHAGGNQGHLSRESAQPRDLARVGALVHQADHHEQQSGDDAVREHLVGRAHQPGRAERADTEQHQPHVAHGRVGDEPLHVASAAA